MRYLMLASCLSLAAMSAQAQIYRCENASGVIEYSNTPVAGKDRSCKAVNLPDVTTIPAPKLPARAAATATPTPSTFPKVDSTVQKARDNDRKRIIEDELQKEESKLAETKREFNNGEPERRGDERNYQRYLDRVQKLKEDIERSESNVNSLKRELGS